MSKLLTLALLILLSGCVSYYYPETALEDGVYYAEDDPAYVVYQGGHPGAAYYPWSTLDYFYLGYQPYPRCSYYYGFPCGMVIGYSPWFYPYGHYGYYSPWYASFYHYPFYPSWQPYDGYCRHDRVCGGSDGVAYRDNGFNRHAKYDSSRYAGDEDDVTGDNEQPASNAASRTSHGVYGTSPFSRYVSAAPAGYSGNRGMVIRSNESRKIGKSRLEPGKTAPVTGSRQVTIRPQPAPASRSYSRPSAAPTSRAPARSSARSRSGISSSGRSRSSLKSTTRDDHN